MKAFFRYLRIKVTTSRAVEWTEEELEKLNGAIKKFLSKLSNEAQETKIAASILRKYIKEGKVSKEEEEVFREQFIDILKAMGVGIPFAVIPGASLLLPLVAKISSKYGINIFPSSFRDDDKEKQGS